MNCNEFSIDDIITELKSVGFNVIKHDDVHSIEYYIEVIYNNKNVLFYQKCINYCYGNYYASCQNNIFHQEKYITGEQDFHKAIKTIKKFPEKIKHQIIRKRLRNMEKDF